VRPPRHKKAPASSGALCFMRLRSLPGGRGDHMAFAVVGPGLLCCSRWPNQGIIGVAESLAHSCGARVPLCVCRWAAAAIWTVDAAISEAPRKGRTVFRIVVSVNLQLRYSEASAEATAPRLCVWCFDDVVQDDVLANHPEILSRHFPVAGS
jgi:hypothetical protein